MQNNATAYAIATPPRLLIVDGHSYAYRAFFAIRRLSSPTGRPTNAIYGFIRMLMKVRAAIQPSHIAVVWDGGLAFERMELLPQYKAQRLEMPSDLEQQFDEITAYLKAAGISTWVKDGVEADDCIAALAIQAENKGMEVVIASSDKDFMQLVSEKVRMTVPSDKTQSLVGLAEVEQKTGVRPLQMVDWLSLVGDAVDNIPGVPGVGPKTASQLLRQFDSVEELYRRLTEVKSDRLRKALVEAREVVERNQKLVRLNPNVPCELTLDELVTRQADDQSLRQLFGGWGFATLLRELEEAQWRTGDFFDEKAGGCSA